MSKRVSARSDAIVAAAIALAGLAVYWRTLAPDVVDADGGEFQFAAWTFGFVHPTGYPLYVMLGGVFQQLVPLGNPAFRLNLFTALTASLALAVLYLAAREIAGRSAAVVAAVSFALTRVFWFDASAAEAYDLNAFFLALLVLIALRWKREPRTRWLALFFLAVGLALTHHRTIILWIPAFAVFFAIAGWPLRRSLRSSLSPPRIALFALALLLPLTLYLYIPLRAPSAPYSTLTLTANHDLVLYDNSPAGFANYILGRVFQSELRWDALSAARLCSFPQWLLDQYGAIAGMLGLVGIAALARRREWAALALLATGFAAALVFASLYHIGDIVHYYIPAYLVWALLVAAGVDQITNLLRAPTRPNMPQWLSPAFIALVVLSTVPVQFALNFPEADRSRETSERDQWTRILQEPIPQGAILVSNDRDEMMPMWYMQYVENTRRDLLGLFPLITPEPQYADTGSLIDAALSTQRPVYLVKPMPGIEAKFSVDKADPLWRVVCDCAAEPQHKSGAVLGDRMQLTGYDAWQERSVLKIVLYWKPNAPSALDYTAFVQLFDASGSKVAQGDDHRPGGDVYPMSLWKVGETLRDEQTIQLPANLAPGPYTLTAGMYHYPDMDSLGTPVTVGPVEIR